MRRGSETRIICTLFLFTIMQTYLAFILYFYFIFLYFHNMILEGSFLFLLCLLSTLFMLLMPFMPIYIVILLFILSLATHLVLCSLLLTILYSIRCNNGSYRIMLTAPMDEIFSTHTHTHLQGAYFRNDAKVFSRQFKLSPLLSQYRFPFLELQKFISKLMAAHTDDTHQRR